MHGTIPRLDVSDDFVIIRALRARCASARWQTLAGLKYYFDPKTLIIFYIKIFGFNFKQMQ
jgi:hypothetical protein